MVVGCQRIGNITMFYCLFCNSSSCSMDASSHMLMALSSCFCSAPCCSKIELSELLPDAISASNEAISCSIRAISASASCTFSWLASLTSLVLFALHSSCPSWPLCRLLTGFPLPAWDWLLLMCLMRKERS